MRSLTHAIKNVYQAPKWGHFQYMTTDWLIFYLSNNILSIILSLILSFAWILLSQFNKYFRAFYTGLTIVRLEKSVKCSLWLFGAYLLKGEWNKYTNKHSIKHYNIDAVRWGKKNN